MRLLLALPLVLATAAALAGCHGSSPANDADPAPAMRLTGWFADYNDTIEKDFDATVAPYSDQVLLMESFPPGFQIQGLDARACAELRGKLLDKEYLASVGECKPDADPTNGDDPVSADGGA